MVLRSLVTLGIKKKLLTSKAVFPEGFGQVMVKLDEAEAALKIALTTRDAAEAKIDALFGEEQAARQAIWGPIESV